MGYLKENMHGFSKRKVTGSHFFLDRGPCKKITCILYLVVIIQSAILDFCMRKIIIYHESKYNILLSTTSGFSIRLTCVEPLRTIFLNCHVMLHLEKKNDTSFGVGSE